MLKIKTKKPFGGYPVSAKGTEVHCNSEKLENVRSVKLEADGSGANLWILTLEIAVDPATLFETKEEPTC